MEALDTRRLIDAIERIALNCEEMAASLDRIADSVVTIADREAKDAQTITLKVGLDD